MWQTYIVFVPLWGVCFICGYETAAWLDRRKKRRESQIWWGVDRIEDIEEVIIVNVPKHMLRGVWRAPK